MKSLCLTIYASGVFVCVFSSECVCVAYVNAQDEELVLDNICVGGVLS